MKILLRLALLLPVLLLSGCHECSLTYTYTYYMPVYSTSEEVKLAVSYDPPRSLKNPGRIYLKDGILFINETGEGIHVIDNHNPASPISLGFLVVPGSFDLVVRGSFLYADSYVDLVVFDVTDLSDIKEIGRAEGIFGDGYSYGYQLMGDGLVLTDWKEVENVSVQECEVSLGPSPAMYMYLGGIPYQRGILMLGAKSPDMVGPLSNSAATGPGIGGSTARFTVSHDHLYAINAGRIKVISLADPESPTVGTVIDAWDAETLFPHKSNLMVGSQSGMYIFSLDDPAVPELESKYEHVRSCDPVVVNDTYAYVTLRSGTVCQGFTNQLEVIDITDLKSPELVKTYPMTNPHGLGLDGNLLFICDGADGLKVFDASNVLTIDANRLAHYPGIFAQDVIPFQNVAMMISDTGLHQYSYADPQNIHLISTIPISH